MATSHQVQCTMKSNRSTAHECITHIGGQNGDGTRWKLSKAEAIAGIEDKKWSFYVARPGSPRVDVTIAKTAEGHKYLKTTADGVMPNNLLTLPNCP